MSLITPKMKKFIEDHRSELDSNNWDTISSAISSANFPEKYEDRLKLLIGFIMGDSKIEVSKTPFHDDSNNYLMFEIYISRGSMVGWPISGTRGYAAKSALDDKAKFEESIRRESLDKLIRLGIPYGQSEMIVNASKIVYSKYI